MTEDHATRSREVQRMAVALFAQRGFAATGIRELAAAAGLNSATLYHYAPSGKEELLDGIMRMCLDELIRRGRIAISASTQPDQQLIGLVRAHVGTTALNPRTATVVDQEVRSLTGTRRDDIVALRDTYESMFADALAAGVAQGLFDVADPTVTRLALIEMCNGVSRWYRPDGRLSVPGVEAVFIDLSRRLLRLPPSTDGLSLPDDKAVRLPCEPVDSPESSRA
ncbi:TetR/AcrR family transcriptional regulator [Mycobacterium sp. LTG2003]